MKSFQGVLVKCILLLHICGPATAILSRSINSQASHNNHILREEQSTSLSRKALAVSSEVPVTIQRYAGGATLPSRGGCESHPMGEEEGIILVTSNCDTSNTSVIPEISLKGTATESGNTNVDSINVNLGVSPEGGLAMDFLETSSHKMESSHTACTKLYCGKNPWGENPREDYGSNSATSTGSVGSTVFGLLALAKGAYSRGDGKIQQGARTLDTCTYNVDIFINGCVGRLISVSAPSVRVADADADFAEVITTVDEKTSEFNETVRFTFPNERTKKLGAAIDAPFQIDRVDGHCNCCVCVGRPFIDVSGDMIQATPSFTTDHTCSWSGDSKVANVESESTERDAPNENELILGKEWTRSALGEHASVASFSAFSIALMTNGAPRDLIEDALKAGLDEIRHAKVSFDIASKLMGKDVRPGPLPESTHAFHRNLTELAMAVATEGCVDETLSALAAAAEAEAIDAVLKTGAGMAKYLNISDSTLTWLRDELRKIALDESGHSALAWRSLKWVCSIDDEACKTVNEAVLEERKLAAVFHRRLGSLGIDRGTLMELMACWKNIYTAHIKLSADDDTRENVCVSSSSDTNGTSFLTFLVDNILQSAMCSNTGTSMNQGAISLNR